MDITTAMGVASLVGSGYEPETYLCKFDNDGRRGETHPVSASMTAEEKQEYINQGFVEISKEDWEIYVNEPGKNGTGMIRGEDGKPTDAPAYVPSKEEKLVALDSQYDSDKDQLAKYYLDAVLSGNTELQDELKTELDTLNAEYEIARKEIEEG